MADATAVLAATVLYVGMPHRGRVPAWWLFPVVQLVLLGLLIAGDPGRIDRRSVTLHRLMLALLVVMTFGTILAVIVLAVDILVAVKGVTATVLLGRGAAIWVENVILFSLWYWQIDRGGPAERAAGSASPPSFASRRTPPPSSPRRGGGRPIRTTCTWLHQRHRLQPTDTLPVRRWAKLTMMVQSTLSLVIAILVIARAINVLPG